MAGAIWGSGEGAAEERRRLGRSGIVPRRFYPRSGSLGRIGIVALDRGELSRTAVVAIPCQGLSSVLTGR